MTITDLTNRSLSTPVRLGCFCISGCVDLPIEHVVSDVTDSTVSLTFWFASEKNRPVLVGVSAFRLPDAIAAFQEKCDWWTDGRKKARAKLASGACLDAQTLVPRFAQIATRRDAFITNKHNVIQIFELDSLGIVLHIHSKDASPDEHPDLLKMIKNIELDTTAWEEAPLKTVASKNTGAIHESPLSDAIMAEINELMTKGLEILSLRADATTVECLAALDAYVCGEKRGKKLAAKTSDVTMALGAVVAHILLTDVSWEWVEISASPKSDDSITELVSPNREHILNPFWLVQRARSSKKPPTLTLMLNMIIKDDLPRGHHFAYIRLN